jgi:hypothetical protein
MKKGKQADRAGHDTGAALAVARVAADKSYPGIAPLLKETIRNEDKAAWAEILARIDYSISWPDCREGHL